MNRNAVGGLASIIIPCWNQLEFTRQCITALKRHTRPPWELIVIDNGSTDGTGAYLSGVQDAAAVPVTVIANTTNRGFPAAINQGLQQARGEYLVLLNNDVVVTDAWLDQLIALTTAKTGEQNGLTAKDAKNAKEEKEANGTDRFADETLIGIGQRPNVTVIDFENVSSAADRSLTSPLLRCRATVHNGRKAWRWSVRSDVELCGAAATGRERAVSRHRRDASILPARGATSIAGSGSPCPSCRGSACS